MRRRHLRLVEAPTVTTRERVELSLLLSGVKKERRDEAATISRLYSTRERERHGNVIPLGRHIPPTDQPRGAA